MRPHWLCAARTVRSNGHLKSIFLAGLLAMFVAGCAPASMKLGVEPEVDRLGTLQLGSSDKAQVREVLGEPQGEGASRMPDFPGLRTVWAYDYTETQGQRIGGTLLLVFFDGDVYDGYLWFDATGLIRQTS